MVGGMSPEEFRNYLGLLSRLLRLRASERESIEEELRSHLEERLAALTAKGIEPARAVSMALAEFGDAAALAAEFTAVSRLYKRRWIMRLTVGSIAASIIMAAVLVSYWPGGPARLTQNQAQAQQGDKAMASNESKQEKAGAKDVFAGGKLDANAQTRAKLEKLTKAEFVDMPLSHVLDYFAHELDVQFHMDAKILSEANITSDTPVTFELHNVPAEMILRWIFRDFGEINYYLDNGVIIVTTQDEANQRLETQVYRVDDLICYPSAAKNKETSDSLAKKTIRIDYAALIDLITSTVRPCTWDAVGGPGSLCPYRGTLVVSQTTETHQEIQKLLKDLRQSINPDIEDEPTSTSGGGTGGGQMGSGMMGGRMTSKGGMGIGSGGMFYGKGGMESGNKESNKKDSEQPSSENEKKNPKDSGGEKGQF